MTAEKAQEAEVQEIRRLAALALARYRTHEDWEDILQEAWLHSWRQWQRCRGRWALTTVVRVAARAAAIDWLRSRRARRPWRRPGVRPAPEFCFIAEVDAADLPLTEDPASGIVSRLEAARAARRALSTMTGPEADAVRQTIMAEESYSEYARLQGRSVTAVRARAMAGLVKARRILLGGGYWLEEESDATGEPAGCGPSPRPV